MSAAIRPLGLGHAGAHQRDERDGDDAEAGEVRHERREDEADALDREQAVDRDRDLLEVPAVLVVRGSSGSRIGCVESS